MSGRESLGWKGLIGCIGSRGFIGVMGFRSRV